MIGFGELERIGECQKHPAVEIERCLGSPRRRDMDVPTEMAVDEVINIHTPGTSLTNKPPPLRPGVEIRGLRSVWHMANASCAW